MQQLDVPVTDSLLDKIRIRDVIQATLLLAMVVAGGLLVYRFFYILFAVLIAIMLYLAIRPLIALLERMKISKQLGMIIGYGLMLLLVVGFLVLLIPLLITQARTITDKLPEYYDLIRQFLAQSNLDLFRVINSYLPSELHLEWIPDVLISSVESSTSDGTQVAVTTGTSMFSPNNLFATMFLIISVFAMAYYWMRDREKIIYRFLLLLPSTRRATVKTLIEELEQKVGRYYQGQLILCTVVGGASFLGYWAIGLPYALTLGAFAFVLEAVPMIGPILGAIPAILIAATISPTAILLVIFINSIIQFLENNVLVPRIMDRTVGVNPILTVLAIAGFSTLLGLLGALLAIPLAAIIQVLFERIVFHFRPPDSESTLLTESPMPKISERNLYSALRFEAQELVLDIRKQLRAKDPATTNENVEVEELIESYVLELDKLLSLQELSVAEHPVR